MAETQLQKDIMSSFQMPGAIVQPNTFGATGSVGKQLNPQASYLTAINNPAAATPGMSPAYEQANIDLLNAQTKKMGETDWMGGAQIGIGAVGAGLGVASYFDNKKMQKAQLEGMRENLAIVREERDRRNEVREANRSAFAEKPRQTAQTVASV